MKKCIRIVILGTFFFGVSIPAFAVPTAQCRNEDKSISVDFIYYKILHSDPVQVQLDVVTLNMEGKTYHAYQAGADDKTLDLMMNGKVPFENGTLLTVSSLSNFPGDFEVVYQVVLHDNTGETLATLDCE